MKKIIVLSLLCIFMYACTNFAYNKGTLTETAWENKSLNMRFTSSKCCTIMPEEQMAMIFSSDDTTINELLAYGANDSHILLMVQKLSDDTADITESEYLEAIQYQETVMMDSLGITNYSFHELSTITIAKQKYATITIEKTIENIPTTTEYAVRKAGKYLVVLTITYLDEKARGELLASLTTY
ncbi:MAG: hypothetical protein LBV04_07085 [Deferribacteraceae bacterium]|jgi:hypothetical protein|nr:hypothetical protein [Deferribacteraceae bacterium]